jgi:hypothetical protein
MFCPNCGNKFDENLKYCRNCGLPLARIARITAEEAVHLSGKGPGFSERIFGKLATGFFAAFAVVGFGAIFFLAVYFKFRIFGQEMMAWFGVFGFFLLAFLGILFYGLKHFLAGRRYSELFEDEVSAISAEPESLTLEEADQADAAIEAFETKRLRDDR